MSHFYFIRNKRAVLIHRGFYGSLEELIEAARDAKRLFDVPVKIAKGRLQVQLKVASDAMVNEAFKALPTAKYPGR